MGEVGLHLVALGVVAHQPAGQSLASDHDRVVRAVLLENGGVYQVETKAEGLLTFQTLAFVWICPKETKSPAFFEAFLFVSVPLI